MLTYFTTQMMREIEAGICSDDSDVEFNARLLSGKVKFTGESYIVCVCVCMCMCVTERERARARQRERERKRWRGETERKNERERTSEREEPRDLARKRGREGKRKKGAHDCETSLARPLLVHVSRCPSVT